MTTHFTQPTSSLPSKPISFEDAVALYRSVWTIRSAEEMVRREYSSDQMKTPVHLSNGAELIAAAVICALPADAPVFGTYRSHALYLAKTGDLDGFFAELYGRATGGSKGKAGSMHLSNPQRGLMFTSAVVGTTIPVAVGSAFAAAYQGKITPTAVFFGDGAIEEGVFWESLNFALLKKLKVLFVCEDNQLAIHTFKKDRQGFGSIEAAVKSWGIPVETAAGYDPDQLLQAVARAVGHLEYGPVFLRSEYFRELEHVGIYEDFKFAYRDKPSETDMKRMNAVDRMEVWAERVGIAAEARLEIRANVDAQISASVQKAMHAPFAAVGELLTDVTD